MSVRSIVVTAVVLAAAAALATSCGSTDRRLPEPAVTTDPSSRVALSTPRRCHGDEPGLGGRRVAYAAVARGQTVAYRRPGRSRIATFGVKNVNGHATVFGVRRAVFDRNCEIAWYRVALPAGQGVEGYVDVDDVRLYRLRARIVVDVSARTLTLYRSGRPTLRTQVAVGAPSTPTPVGRFYVDQRLIPADPTGPWGPGALGLSARSEVLRSWPQRGPIAIHGTNDPSSIGRAASHGCVRLPNSVLRRVFAATEAGTPVIIRA